jgi:hypothetical protein
LPASSSLPALPDINSQKSVCYYLFTLYSAVLFSFENFLPALLSPFFPPSSSRFTPSAVLAPAPGDFTEGNAELSDAVGDLFRV